MEMAEVSVSIAAVSVILPAAISLFIFSHKAPELPVRMLRMTAHRLPLCPVLHQAEALRGPKTLRGQDLGNTNVPVPVEGLFIPNCPDCINTPRNSKAGAHPAIGHEVATVTRNPSSSGQSSI